MESTQKYFSHKMKLDCGILPRIPVLEVYTVSQKRLDKSREESKQKKKNLIQYATIHLQDLKQMLQCHEFFLGYCLPWPVLTTR